MLEGSGGEPAIELVPESDTGVRQDVMFNKIMTCLNTLHELIAHLYRFSHLDRRRGGPPRLQARHSSSSSRPHRNAFEVTIATSRPTVRQTILREGRETRSRVLPSPSFKPRRASRVERPAATELPAASMQVAPVQAVRYQGRATAVRCVLPRPRLLVRPVQVVKEGRPPRKRFRATRGLRASTPTRTTRLR